ncbi:MAG: MOSC N-terminal beta barrel domain-containing protein [Dehalococcoidia bacterium]
MAGELGTIDRLWRYPVKSMLGEELEESPVGERGLLGDRSYALYDPASNRIGSAKQPRVWGRLFGLQASLADAGPPPRVSVRFPDGTSAESGDDGLEARLSAELGFEVRLVAAPPEGATYMSVPVSGDESEAAVSPVRNGLFDLGVVHLLATGTLEHLSLLYPDGRFEAQRFRPNLLVRTPPGERAQTGARTGGFLENGWVGKTLALGDEVRLRVFTVTPRCVMTTLPQGSLPNDPGILRAAAANNQSNVGVYAIVERGGVVRRGDGVAVC